MFGHKEQYHPRNILVLNVASMTISAATAVLLYFQSRFLVQIVGERWVGTVFFFSSFVLLALAYPIKRWSQQWNLRNAASVVLLMTASSLALLAWVESAWLSVALFVTYSLGFFILQMFIDVLMECFSTDAKTGRIRSVRLTLYNIAVALSPLVGGYLLGLRGYALAFALSAGLLLPAILLFDRLDLRRVRLPKQSQHLLQGIAKVVNDPALSRIFLLALMLQFFYGVMVMYTPLYLLGNGYTTAGLGGVLFVILLPFVLLQIPAGWIADRILGEKELFVLGVISLALGTMLFAIVPPGSVGLVMATLFLSRIGASLIEVMRDSAFFKHIASNDSTLITLLWMSSPLGFLIAAMTGTYMLYYGTYGSLFFLTGLLSLTTLPAVLTLKDTR